MGLKLREFKQANGKRLYQLTVLVVNDFVSAINAVFECSSLLLEILEHVVTW